MITDTDLKKVIEQVLMEMSLGKQNKEVEQIVNKNLCENKDLFENIDLPDITSIDLRKDFHIENPKNKEAYLKLKEITPARLGVGRCGVRYRTETLLRFRADHAAAMDAVWNDVSEDFLNKNNLFTVKTLISNKDEFITRPDLGRIVDEEGIKTLKERCKLKPRALIYLADGLSSTAIEANGIDTLASITQGLKAYGIEIGTPFFLKYGRVGSMDHISEILEPEVIAVLIGERPGLVTGESMSCYMTYKAYRGIPEAKRTVISNIHRQGTPAAEAGAHIADILKKMLDEKASGLDLKL